MGFDVAECLEFTENSPVQQMFRTLLFSRIVPCVKDIGLWGPKVRHAYADLGVLDAAKSDLEALMRGDEQIAERMDREYAAEFAARTAEVDAAVTGARQASGLAGPAAWLVRWEAWTPWTASSVSCSKPTGSRASCGAAR